MKHDMLGLFYWCVTWHVTHQTIVDVTCIAAKA